MMRGLSLVMICAVAFGCGSMSFTRAGTIRAGDVEPTVAWSEGVAGAQGLGGRIGENVIVLTNAGSVVYSPEGEPLFTLRLHERGGPVARVIDDAGTMLVYTPPISWSSTGRHWADHESRLRIVTRDGRELAARTVPTYVDAVVRRPGEIVVALRNGIAWLDNALHIYDVQRLPSRGEAVADTLRLDAAGNVYIGEAIGESTIITRYGQDRRPARIFTITGSTFGFDLLPAPDGMLYILVGQLRGVVAQTANIFAVGPDSALRWQAHAGNGTSFEGANIVWYGPGRIAVVSVEKITYYNADGTVASVINTIAPTGPDDSPRGFQGAQVGANGTLYTGGVTPMAFDAQGRELWRANAETPVDRSYVQLVDRGLYVLRHGYWGEDTPPPVLAFLPANGSARPTTPTQTATNPAPTILSENFRYGLGADGPPIANLSALPALEAPPERSREQEQCFLGNPGDCATAGAALGATTDPATVWLAQSMLAFACMRGVGEACTHLDQLFAAQTNGEQKLALATAACVAGVGGVCGWSSENGALAASITLCHAGDVAGCRRAGQQVLAGRAGRDDPQMAAGLLARAADHHDGEASAALGSLMAEGRGVPRAVPNAEALLQTGCATGVAGACEERQRLTRARLVAEGTLETVPFCSNRPPPQVIVNHPSTEGTSACYECADGEHLRAEPLQFWDDYETCRLRPGEDEFSYNVTRTLYCPNGQNTCGGGGSGIGMQPPQGPMTHPLNIFTPQMRAEADARAAAFLQEYLAYRQSHPLCPLC